MGPYGDGADSVPTTTPPGIVRRVRVSTAVAPCAIAGAALPSATTQTRLLLGMSRDSTPRAVAGVGSAPATAASYSAVSSSRSVATLTLPACYYFGSAAPLPLACLTAC